MPNDFEFLDDEPVIEETPQADPAPKQDAPVNRREQDQQRFNQQLQQERQQYQQPPKADPKAVDQYVDERAMSVAQDQASLQLAMYKTEQKYPELNTPQGRAWVGTEADRIYREAQTKGEYMTHEQVLEKAAQAVKEGIQQFAQSNQPKPIDRLAIDMGVGNGDAPQKQTRLTVQGIKDMSDADFRKMDERLLSHL